MNKIAHVPVTLQGELITISHEKEIPQGTTGGDLNNYGHSSQAGVVVGDISYVSGSQPKCSRLGA
jgi:hypothetical protein